jgi:hypothetical protein
MNDTSLLWMTLTLALTCVLAASAQETRKTLRLKDHINHAWSDELLTYTLTFEPGECHPSSVELEGPEGPLPCQLSDLVTDAAGFATSAQLSFVTSLPALGEKTFTVRCDSEPIEDRDAPAADLEVTEGKGFIELATRRAAVRLLTGTKKYSVPLAAADVPGPIVSLRTLEGVWFGGSSLYGKRRVTGYQVKIDAAGPVFCSVIISYDYETGEHLEVRARLVASQEAVFLESTSGVHRPDDGWRLNLTSAYPAPILSVIGEYERNKWGLQQDEIGHVDLHTERPEVLYQLVPWEDWYNGTTRTVFSLHSPQSGTVLAIGSHDPGAWNDPAWGEESERHRYPFVPVSHWERQLFKAMPLVKGSEGEIFLQCSTHVGQRKWFIGFVPKNQDADRCYLDAVALHDAKYGCQTLDLVKEYDLEWPTDAALVHPRLYVAEGERAEAQEELGNAATIEGNYRRQYRDDAGQPYTLSGRSLTQYMVDSAYLASRHLVTLQDNQNKFDLMRHGILLVNMYDALMGTGELSAEEQTLLRAQIAFLGYRLNSPYVWDMDRGFAGDPNNMHLSYMCTLGLVACAIPDHPMAKEWAAKAVKWVKLRLDEHVGENGVWTIENMHYTNVSLAGILPFAMAAQKAGFYDFLNDGKLSAALLYTVKQLTPRNPLRGNVRTQPPDIVQVRGAPNALAGVVAKASAQVSPDYAELMQWAWLEQGTPSSIPDSRFGGFDPLVTDPSLPAALPDWHSEAFPTASVVFRHGLGTPDEYYLVLPIYRRPYADYYLPVPGGVTIFAKGQPLVQLMTAGYGESFFTNGVSMARSPAATQEERGRNKGYFGNAYIRHFSAMPRQDYALAEFNLDQPLRMRPEYVDMLPPLPHWPRLLGEATRGGLTWQRQILFIKGTLASDASYFLFRDTVTDSGQWMMGPSQPREPTMWSMWTLSEKVGTREESRDEASPSDLPGDRMTPARELAGDRFTSVGQFGVDVDYYVALPQDTPRATMRWGYVEDQQRENQDLLHLQRTDEGAYYVAFFPRRRQEPAPVFETLGDGTVIKTSGEFGTDYGFLSAEDTGVDAENARFRGTAASVQDRQDGLVLTLGASGEVYFGAYGLVADNAVSTLFADGKVTISISRDRQESQQVELAVPSGYRLFSPDGRIEVTANGNGLYRTVIPRGTIDAILEMQER